MQELNDVINWRRWNENITLSGQPTEGQMAEIKALGVKHIINLGPHDNNGALDDEAATLSALGLEYIYIPVDFENPTDADFEKFCVALEKLEDKKIHVHCIYNARVSAFFYRYANEGKGGSIDEAHSLMDGIWRPGGVWAKFIGDDTALDQPSRYSGYNY